jgi:hypothetical protein
MKKKHQNEKNEEKTTSKVENLKKKNLVIEKC